MESYQQRVVDEKIMLDMKLENLEQYINGSSNFASLPEDERTRLRKQAGFMRGYSDVLAERIAAF